MHGGVAQWARRVHDALLFMFVPEGRRQIVSRKSQRCLPLGDRARFLFSVRGVCGAETFLTTETDAPEFCDAAVTSPARVMRQHYPALEKALDGDQHMASGLRKAAGAALASKLIQVMQGE